MWIRQQLDTGDEKHIANEASSFAGCERITEWDVNVDLAMGRGVADSDRTYLALRRSDGTKVYIYVDTGTTVVCSATQP